MKSQCKPVIRLAATLILTGVIVTGLCSGGWWFGVSEDDLDDVITAMRARGEAPTLADVARSPVREHEDGGKMLRDAYEWLRNEGPPEAEWPRTDDLTLATFVQLPREKQAALRAFTESIGPFLTLVRRASTKRQLRLGPPADGSEPLGDQSRGGLLSRTVRLLRHARITSWQEGDQSAYLDLVRVQADLAAHVMATSSSSEAVRAADALGDVLVAGQHALRFGDCPAQDIRAAVAPALTYDADALFRSALRLDRAWWMTVMAKMSGDVAGGRPTGEELFPRTPWRDRSVRAGAIAWLRTVDHVLDAPTGDHLETARRLRAWGDRPNPYWVATFDPGRAVLGLARVMPPALCRQTTSLAALQRICDLALAAEAQHEESGLWPRSLADVAFEVPQDGLIDAFTGGEIAFEAHGDGVVISCRGPVDARVWGRAALPPNAPLVRALAWDLRR